MLFGIGCTDTDIEMEDFFNDPETIEAELQFVTGGLNYPVGVDFIDNEHPAGIGECSVLPVNHLLTANSGIAGNFAESVVRVDPNTGGKFLFSDWTFLDGFGQPAVDRPTGVDFQGHFVWVSNIADYLGSISVLDPNPCLEPNGPNQRAGEPVTGPLGTGVFNHEDFGFTVLDMIPCGEENVSTSARVYVRFSQPVNPLTVTINSLELEVEDSPAKLDDPIYDFVFSEENRLVEFRYQHYQSLGENTVYRITADDDIEDMYGNPLDVLSRSPGPDSGYCFFATGKGSNPQVVWVYPEDGASNVSIWVTVQVRFSKPIKKPSSEALAIRNEESFTKPSGQFITMSEDLMTAYINLRQPLDEDKCYYIQATSEITDLMGNPLDQIPGGSLDSFQSFFCTGAPTGEYFCVQEVTPDPAGGQIPVDTAFSVTFNREVDQSTLVLNDTVRFTRSGGGAVPGSLIPLSYGFTFDPSSNLAQCDQINLTLTTGIRDINGESLDGGCDGTGQNYNASFYVVCENPYVASTSPACGTQNVPVNHPFVINFSEEMDWGSLNEETILLTDGTEYTDITIQLQDTAGYTTATISPSGADFWDSLTDYCLHVTIYAKDRQGNYLDADRNPLNGLTPFECCFKTGFETQDVPPTMVSAVPAPGATDVPITSIVTVCFSKEMAVDTINSDTFYVLDEMGKVPPDPFSGYTVDYNCITFNPASLLSENTQHMVVITTDVRDVYGLSVDGDNDGDEGPGIEYSFWTGEGDVLINEIVVDPIQDWSDDEGGDGVPFNDVPGTANPGNSDEWIELFNLKSGQTDLSNYMIEVIDSSPEAPFTLGDPPDGTVVVTGGPYDLSNVPELGYIVVGNPSGTMNQSCYVKLYDDGGVLIDDVEIGDKDFKGDGTSNNAPEGGADSITDEAVARCPNGKDSDSDVDDWVQQTATINSSNDPYCTVGASIGGRANADEKQVAGIGGISYGGPAPDNPGPFSSIFYAFNSYYDNIYIVDYDDGIYVLTAEIEEISAIEYIPELDEAGNIIPGTGILAVTTFENAFHMIHIAPSGAVGSAGTVPAIDYSQDVPIKSIGDHRVKNPCALAYSKASRNLFMACKGSGNVLEFNSQGDLLTVYDTGLGPDVLSGLDVGNPGDGETAFITEIGGRGYSEASGPHGTLYKFKTVN